ncbi:MAG: hypothetical protein ACK4TF_03075 [Thermodesulfovibrionales bacterium]
MKRYNVSDPKVLIGLSVFLMVMGVTVLDPLAGLIFLTLAGILALIAGLYGRRLLRYIAFLLLIIIIAQAVSTFHEASSFLKAIRAYKATRGIKMI